MVEEKKKAKKSWANEPVDAAKIRSIIEANNGALLRTWLGICARCGLCADSCFYYLASDRDPKLSPAYKLKSTLGEMYRKKGKVSRKFLDEHFETLWTQCTACRRCSMHCPFGIDIASMMMLARNIFHSQGVSPKTLEEFVENCRTTGNHAGLPLEELEEVFEWMVEESEDDYRGVEIPVDKTGAKYMYVVNPREIEFYPQDLGNAAILFTLTEESWTMPTSGWDCTNIPMLAGDRELAGQMVRNVYDQALALDAKKILITECGHANASLAYLGPYWTGQPGGKPPVEVVHYVKWLRDCLVDGRIQIDPNKKIKEPITYHDPCGVSRNGGLFDEAREIMERIAEDFREMTPNREHNHCCGGGSGLMPMGPDYKAGRLKAGRVKAEQIKATDAKIVIATCHNCFAQIGDLSKEYDLGVKVVSLKDLVLETMVVPEKFKPKERDGGPKERDGE